MFQMNIYVGNLAFGAGEEEVREAFAAYGQVASVAIIKDQFTGKSRGFAFVEMPNSNEANAAIAALNGKDMLGRALTVNEARPRAERSGGGERRGGFGGRDRGQGGRGGNRQGGGRSNW
jgi:RNA recognition motif-containing protein